MLINVGMPVNVTKNNQSFNGRVCDHYFKTIYVPNPNGGDPVATQGEYVGSAVRCKKGCIQTALPENMRVISEADLG